MTQHADLAIQAFVSTMWEGMKRKVYKTGPGDSELNYTNVLALYTAHHRKNIVLS